MLEGLSYVDAVLWVGARLADGLAHAHERGVLHRDLKPANVLITEEGQPLLLDFNLAASAGDGGVNAALVGGTLPYMAPEHLEALDGGTLPVDERSDVYSLGVVLYELLCLRHPFTVFPGPTAERVPVLVAERRRGAPRLRRWNGAVSPAVESIVRRCLEPDPRRRYQSAGQLREDLERQLDHRPLRHAPEVSAAERAGKWVRRHRRLTLAAAVGVVAAVIIGPLALALAASGHRVAGLEARAALHRFEADRPLAEFLVSSRALPDGERAAGREACRLLLDRYRVIDDPDWRRSPSFALLAAEEQQRLMLELGQGLLLLAHATAREAALAPPSAERTETLEFAGRLVARAESCYSRPSRAAAVYRARLARLLGREEDARQLAEAEEVVPYRDAWDRYLVAVDRMDTGRFADAVPLLDEATRADPSAFCFWFALGLCCDHLGRDPEAARHYTTAIALWPRRHWVPYCNRGLSHFKQREFALALDDFTTAAGLRPDAPEPLLNRALALQALGKPAEAVEDLTRALDNGAPAARVHFMRARAREQAGDAEGARLDREAGLRLEPADELGWVARAVARAGTDPDGALADFDRALRLNPASLQALLGKASVLARDRRRQEESLAVLDRAVELYPDFALARSGRGVLLARLGRRDDAHRDAEACLLRDGRPPALYQVAGIYALTSKEHPEDRAPALRLLASALRQGFGFELLAQDPELDPVRDLPEFHRVVEAARALQAGPTDAGPSAFPRETKDRP
jgi:tetratricopeptide (TPR) repeat protein